MFSQFFKANSKDKSSISDEIEAVTQFISQYQHSSMPQGLAELIARDAIVCKVITQGKQLDVQLTLPFPCAPFLADLQQSLQQQFGKRVKLAPQLNIQPVRQHNIAGVSNIIAVASGKGGVGKSTTTANLARALQALGAKVGVLDADIYGPSIPTIFGLQHEKPTSSDGKSLMPLDAQGIQTMSIGYLMAENDATVWRGPMASSAFNQLLTETQWQNLDYLLIDMPPGTGDIQLTLAQKVPVAGAVIVTTPQNLALADANKGITMFNKVAVPVLGVVENMSYFQCENCGHQSPIFGEQGGDQLVAQHQVPLLGQLPLNQHLRAYADNGQSPWQQQDSDITNNYRTIAENLVAQLFYQLDVRSPENPLVEIIEEAKI